MSRIGKMPILIPKGVKAEIKGTRLHVEGPKGKLDLNVDAELVIEISDGKIDCTLQTDSTARERHGLFRNLIANMVKGCSEGFRKVLEVNGVGYRATLKGSELELALGYSHPILYKIPEGITIAVEPKTSRMTIEGADRQLVGQTASEIRSFRKPEPYKGKGIKYATETIRRKVGKAAAATTAA
ncbi:MAG: 50S ribosomal protein L6 [Pseudomonadota bacterium]